MSIISLKQSPLSVKKIYFKFVDELLFNEINFWGILSKIFFNDSTLGKNIGFTFIMSLAQVLWKFNELVIECLLKSPSEILPIILFSLFKTTSIPFIALKPFSNFKAISFISEFSNTYNSLIIIYFLYYYTNLLNLLDLNYHN